MSVMLKTRRTRITTYEVKFPEMEMAPVLFKLPKPSMVVKSVLLAMKRAPAVMVAKFGMEMLVKYGLAWKVRSPTVVRFGAMMDSK